jgi:anthranilate phosphoribosyltransferase
MVQVLRELGAERALVVHSAEGLDEISPSGPTRTWELRDGAIRESELTPEAVGLERAPRESVRGGDSATNAGIARAVLSGEARDGARTAVLLNAGAACYVAGRAPDVRTGVTMAAEAIASGAASATLERWVARSVTLS